jgi:hypothetical protein
MNATLKIVNILMFVAMIVMNYLANALPINGKTTGELSAQYPNLFVPAGITFSIWGIIYLMLFVFLIIQFHSQNKELIAAIGWAFAISCALNGLWIVAWHYENLLVSFLIMIGLLVTLVYINFKLTGFSNIFTKIAFGVYLGWICIATIANVTALLVDYSWGGWGISHETWAIVMIIAGAAISAVALIRLQNPFLGLALLWAFTGIIIKQQGVHPSIVFTAVAGIIFVGAIMIMVFVQKNRFLFPG